MASLSALMALPFLLIGLTAAPSWISGHDRTDTHTSPSPAAVTPATQEELGRLLFFAGRLSGDGSVSCSTCHQPDKAWTDGQALSRGYTNTLYFRNTPTLINASQMPLLDSDGRFAQGDMSSAIRDHVAEAHFMNIDGRLLVEHLRQVPEYEEGFKEVFGSEVSYGRVLNSLSAFVETLVSQNNPYLRSMDGDAGALTAQAQAGLELFNGKAGCNRCHGDELLSDGGLHGLGVPENPDIFQEPERHIVFRRFFRGFGIGEFVTMREDPGLFAVTFEEEDRGKFRTPSLLEVARTAPYMHNGIFSTLEEVVKFYNQGGGDRANKDPLLEPLGLTDEEMEALTAFLESLGSELTPFDVPELPSYQPRTLGEN